MVKDPVDKVLEMHWEKGDIVHSMYTRKDSGARPEGRNSHAGWSGCSGTRRLILLAGSAWDGIRGSPALTLTATDAVVKVARAQGPEIVGRDMPIPKVGREPFDLTLVGLPISSPKPVHIAFVDTLAQNASKIPEPDDVYQ